MTTELIRLEGINKSFGNVQGLKDIDLKIDSGEIVALLGDNGAGKSTLIKALSGVYPIDKGAIFFKGKHASIRSARAAIDLGIETIHQDSSLAPDLSIANNLFLGREPMRYAWMGAFSPIDRAYVESRTRELLRKAGIRQAPAMQRPQRLA